MLVTDLPEWEYKVFANKLLEGMEFRKGQAYGEEIIVIYDTTNNRQVSCAAREFNKLVFTEMLNSLKMARSSDASN